MAQLQISYLETVISYLETESPQLRVSHWMGKSIRLFCIKSYASFR